MKMKIKELETAAFKLQVSITYGVWDIKRKADNAISDNETGSEGLERYRHMQKMFRENRAAFDSACRSYTFHDESGLEVEEPEPVKKHRPVAKETLLQFAQTIARMKYDGEDAPEQSGKDFYLMENDDAVTTLSELIVEARRLLEGV